MDHLSASMSTEESTNREYPKEAQWFDLSCPAACSIIAGLALVSIWFRDPPPLYVLIIKDVLGSGLLVVGVFLAWKWHKLFTQRPELAEIAMKKSDTGWVPLALTGLVLVLLAVLYGFITGGPPLLDYLDYVFLAGGVAAFILAAHKFQRRNFSTE